MAESGWSNLPVPGADLVLTVGISDVVAGDTIEDLQHAMHVDSERSVGPMRCKYTTFDNDRERFATFLKACELPAEAITEYMAGWDAFRHPIACVHWGTPMSPGIANARLN